MFPLVVVVVQYQSLFQTKTNKWSELRLFSLFFSSLSVSCWENMNDVRLKCVRLSPLPMIICQVWSSHTRTQRQLVPGDFKSSHHLIDIIGWSLRWSSKRKQCRLECAKWVQVGPMICALNRWEMLTCQLSRLLSGRQASKQTNKQTDSLIHAKHFNFNWQV